MELESTIKQVATAEDAVAQFTGEDFMEWLDDYLSEQVAGWPALSAIAQAQPKPEKVKKFMAQRFLAEQAFAGQDADPGFLGFAVANLSESSEPAAEPALGLMEEEKGSAESDSGPALAGWTALLRAVGLSDDDIRRLEPKEPTRNYISEVSDTYSTAEWQATVGAYYAHGKLRAAEARPLTDMLRNLSGIPADAIAALTPDKAESRRLTEMRHILEGLAVDEAEKGLIMQGVLRQLEARRDFYVVLAKYLYE